MNVNYIRDFINNQLGNVQDHDAPDAGQTLLTISAFLLEQIQKEPAAFTRAADDRALRRAFVQCGTIAQILSEFSRQYSAPITQKAQRLLGAIQETSTELERVQKDCSDCETRAGELRDQKDALEDANRDLLARQQQLEARKNELTALTEKLDELHRLDAETAEEKLSAMRTEIEQSEPEILRRQEVFETLHAQIEEITRQLKEIGQSISEAEKQNNRLNDERQQKEDSLNALNASISRQQQQMQELAAAIDQAGETLAGLQELTEANSKIAEAIIANGYVLDDRTNPDSFYARTDDLNRQAKALEEAYDTLLRNVLADARKLLNNLSDRQEPGYTGGAAN